jgi:hypothetical protein
VKIWTNPWINTKGPTRPITPRGQKLVTEVCVLLDPITGNWDEQLVRNTFWEMDSKVILVTPIRDEFEDFYAWQPEEKSVFSAAYKLYIRLRDGTNRSTSGCGEDNTFWKNI